MNFHTYTHSLPPFLRTRSTVPRLLLTCVLEGDEFNGKDTLPIAVLEIPDTLHFSRKPLRVGNSVEDNKANKGLRESRWPPSDSLSADEPRRLGNQRNTSPSEAQQGGGKSHRASP